MPRATSREKSSAASDVKLSQFARRGAVLDLVVETKDDLLRSLAEVVVDGISEGEIERIFQAVVEREAAVNTYVGNGVAIPHARVDFVEGIHVAIARNPDGFPYGIVTEEPVVLVLLVVGNEKLQSEHVHVLGAIAALLVDRERRDEILHAPDATSVLRLLDSRRAPRRRTRPLTQLLLSHARKIAKEMGADAVLVTLESAEELALLRRLPRRQTFIVATSSEKLADKAEDVVDRVLLLPKVPLGQMAGVKLTALMALTHGLIQRGDVVAFLTGNDRGLDTMTILEIGKHLGRFVGSGAVAPGILPEVLERVITLAAELGVEGREGSPVGTIFVIVGDEEKLAGHVQQMVINPFRGYPEEERNILDPTLAETIKEFSSIDGAFVVRGDGVLLSAGTFLKVDVDVELAPGSGSRHRAACAITKSVSCIALALSQSTGQVTLYKNGSVLLEIERSQRG